jgi:abortive infection bacteriophage resistance protein
MVKPFQDYNAQLKILQSRGCQIDDPKFALTILSRLNYYRFTAYLLPFKDKSDTYKPGTNFTTIYQIYEFDRKLRLILFSAIARIEILLRSQLAYYHTGHYGPLGYMDAVNFRPYGHDHTKFLHLISDEIIKNSKVPFVQHHITNYGGQLPLWVMSELFTFGVLSRLYADFHSRDRRQMAKILSVPDEKTLQSWLRCCSDLRNICAHHGRIYYRLFSAAPAGISTSNPLEARRLFAMLLVLKQLYPDKTEWKSEVCAALDGLITEYQADISLQSIGFPLDWLAELTK